MPRYVYRAKSGPSNTLEGELFAENERVALGKIEGLGYCPVWVREKDSGKHSSSPGSVRGIRTRDVNVFTRQLAGLIKSGVHILKALRIAREQCAGRGLQRLVSTLEDDVRDGHMLSESLAKYPSVFPAMYVNMVRSGESGGILDVILLKLAESRDREEEIRGKVRSALAYPALVLVVGIVTVFILVTFFLPKIVNLFRHFSDLPWPTRILIAISDFCGNHWIWIVVPLVLVAAVFQRMASGSTGRKFVDTLKLRIPLAGGLILKSEVARFARTFSLLIEAGIPVERGLTLSGGAMNNAVLRHEIEQVADQAVRQGSQVADGLRTATHFPDYARSMIAVGEEGGRMDETLADVAQFYEREVERSIVTITSLIEPILILFVGALVGFIAMAMMLPIFAVTQAVMK